MSTRFTVYTPPPAGRSSNTTPSRQRDDDDGRSPRRRGTGTGTPNPSQNNGQSASPRRPNRDEVQYKTVPFLNGGAASDDGRSFHPQTPSPGNRYDSPRHTQPHSEYNSSQRQHSRNSTRVDDDSHSTYTPPPRSTSSRSHYSDPNTDHRRHNDMYQFDSIPMESYEQAVRSLRVNNYLMSAESPEPLRRLEPAKLESIFKVLFPKLKSECSDEDVSQYATTIDAASYARGQDAKIHEMYNASVITEVDKRNRESIAARYEQYIIGAVAESGSLVVFGSSVNGFGTRTSDVDMCLITDLSLQPEVVDEQHHDDVDDDDDSDEEHENLNGTPDGEQVEVKTEPVPKEKDKVKKSKQNNQRNDPNRRKCRAMIQRISEVLSSVETAKNITTILDSRVPLVSFTDYVTGLDVDICVNHYVGVYNTLLLKCYANLNPVIGELGYLIKRWAKQVRESSLFCHV